MKCRLASYKWAPLVDQQSMRASAILPVSVVFIFSCASYVVHYFDTARNCEPDSVVTTRQKRISYDVFTNEAIDSAQQINILRQSISNDTRLNSQQGTLL